MSLADGTHQEAVNYGDCIEVAAWLSPLGDVSKQMAATFVGEDKADSHSHLVFTLVCTRSVLQGRERTGWRPT
ncbi:hypothetical protein C0Q70_21552 [Pomacea canaliculata]|uniref:Uncharacterized protein n=1 Tax=Pomacea canaliculata TaxID=400727 RepID=A0A2T7NCU5_POMCA|nr:hypothetical protein C0Q70_21552 [Pomacea canaliculata]